MKWIELNTGSLINLDAVAGIVADENMNGVRYIYIAAEVETRFIEIFETPEQVRSRMEELKQMLLPPHDAAKEILEHTIPYTTP
mgnify:CR=1 FL=1